MLLPPALGSSPCPPVSVYGTGTHEAIAAFLGGRRALFATNVSLRVTVSLAVLRLRRVFPSRPAPCRPRPRSSVHVWYRNVRLLSIAYASRPELRTRLTQGRSALPWKPWTSGREDSHLTLATHSGILPSLHSTAPYGFRFSAQGMLPYQRTLYVPGLRRRVLAPDIFGAGSLD